MGELYASIEAYRVAPVELTSSAVSPVMLGADGAAVVKVASVPFVVPTVLVATKRKW